MGRIQPGRVDLNDFRQRSLAYSLWRQTSEVAAMKLKSPEQYLMLVRYPYHWPKIQEAFAVYWITRKMLE